MKTFKKFLEEASNAITRFRSSGHQLKRKGIPHPDYPDMPHIFKWIYGVEKQAMGKKQFGKNSKPTINPDVLKRPEIIDKNLNAPGNPIKKIKAK